MTYAISGKGVFYFTIEYLNSLDKKYFWKNVSSGGKTLLSCTADTVATISRYKAVKGLKTLLMPEPDITGVNFTVAQVSNAIEDKSLAEKIKVFALNFGY